MLFSMVVSLFCLEVGLLVPVTAPVNVSVFYVKWNSVNR